MHAKILIGYLSVAKLDCYSEASDSLQGYQLFNHCMGMIFESLIEAGKEGVKMVCTDGWIQWVYVILAAYVADFPEQCLVACCMENRCPCCTVDPCEQGSPIESWLRDKLQMLETLMKHKQGRDPLQFKNKAYLLCISPSGPISLTVIYLTASLQIFFTSFIKASSRTILSNGVHS